MSLSVESHRRGIRRSTRRFFLAGGLVVLALVLGVGVWSATAMISGAVMLNGELRSESKRKVVQHLEGGLVDEILVRDGDFVERGDILIRLQRTTLLAQVEIVDAQLDELMARRARLEAERLDETMLQASTAAVSRANARAKARMMLDNEARLFEARRETLGQQINQLDGRIAQTGDEVSGMKAQISALDRQLVLIRSELEDQRYLLDRGLTQRPRVTALEREEARLKGQRGALLAAEAQARGRMSELAMRKLELRAVRREEAIGQLPEVTTRIAELREQRSALAEALARTEIRAPHSGVVLDMAIDTIGGVIAPGEPLLHIVPANDELVVEARFDPVSRDQLRPMQDATLVFTNFNRRTTPELQGVVSTIGADALTDPRSGASYYSLEIRIPKAELRRLREAIETDLVPGMPVEAYVRTDARSVSSYLLRPLTDSFRRTFREE